MNEKEFAELSAGHALRTLSPGDERVYLGALAAHPEWRGIAEADAATVSALGDAVAEVPPPAYLRASILAAVADSASAPNTGSDREREAAEDGPRSPAGEAQVPKAEDEVSTEEPPKRTGPRWGRWSLALAACLVLLGGAGFGAVSLGEWLNRPPAAVVALDEIESASDARVATVQLGDGGEASAHWSESVGEAVVVTDGLPAITADQSFELWFVRGDEPISAGTFEAGGDGVATTLLDGEIHEGDVIAVTIEPAGGSPTGQPTSDPIIAIDTA